MIFAEYYNELFREDVARVVTGLPARHDHGPDEVTIQPRSISGRNPVIRAWPDDRRALFACGLFLTVLADQVCYTHFRASYPTFRALTRYPKWRGDCPGGCYSHIHPGAVFYAIGAEEGRLPAWPAFPLSLLPGDLVATMQREIADFVGRFLPGVDQGAFWRHCDAEFPLGIRIALAL